jgi:hypothetical protein
MERAAPHEEVRRDRRSPERRRRAVLDGILTRVVNPVVRWVLTSPVHDLLGPRLAVLGITGRRSGRVFRVPVNVLSDGSELVALSQADRRWWRNLRAGGAVTVLLNGRECRGSAHVDEELPRDAVADLVERAYAEAGHPIPRARASALAADRVVVRIAPGAGHRPPEPLRGGKLWRRWTATVTAGEALGFAAPAAVGATLTALNGPWTVLVPVTLTAGAVEGAVLGFAQALVLRRAIPAIATRAWIAATMAGALCAWTVGLVPMLAGDGLADLPPTVQVGLGAGLGSVLLVSMGAFQWRVLRRTVPGAGLWVPATATAWLLGLAAFAGVSSPLWREGQPAALVAAIGVAAGCVMAATAAAVTGAALVRLTAPRRDGAPHGDREGRQVAQPLPTR